MYTRALGTGEWTCLCHECGRAFTPLLNVGVFFHPQTLQRVCVLRVTAETHGPTSAADTTPIVGHYGPTVSRIHSFISPRNGSKKNRIERGLN